MERVDLVEGERDPLYSDG